MIIVKAGIFASHREVQFGFSTKFGLERPAPFHFNLSLSVGDQEKLVLENRNHFFKAVGVSYNDIAFQKQVHGDDVRVIEKPGFAGESDSLITTKKGIGLAVSTGDCVPVFLYDKKKSIIAAIHSGWRSTEKQITRKTLNILKTEFRSSPNDLIAYIGPSIQWQNYNVGSEVARLFDPRFVHRRNGTIFIDLIAANYSMLAEFGLPAGNIQTSHFCSYGMKNLLHSYRREGAASGRAYGVIALKEYNR